MEASRRDYAQSARGFLPPDEGDVLYEVACDLSVEGPLLEVGSYCGKSAVYLGTAAEEQGRVLYALDHHRGSEENQVGWEYHDNDLFDKETGRIISKK